MKMTMTRWMLSLVAACGLATTSIAQDCTEPTCEIPACEMSRPCDDLACDSICNCGQGCDGGCDGSCGSLLGGLNLVKNDRLFGLFAHTDYCFNDFISPMTNPVFFEDPRTLTEARFIYIHHKTPQLAGAIPSSSLDLFAMQVRAALTQRLSIVASKDGYVFAEDTLQPLVDDGWADISAGLKYNIIRNPDTQTIVSAGFNYEMQTGSNKALQGNGAGLWSLYTSAGQQLGECSHWVSSFGVLLPNNTFAENQMLFWSNHLDRKVTDRLYLFTEANWYNYLSSGGAFPLPVEGGDLHNIGSVGVTGNDLVTAAFGAKLKPGKRSEIGVAFEVPVTERRGLLDNRLTIDYIIRY